MDPLTFAVEVAMGAGFGFFLGWLTRRLWAVFVGLALIAVAGILFMGYSIPQYVEWLRTYAKPLIDLLEGHKAIALGAVVGFLLGLAKKR